MARPSLAELKARFKEKDQQKKNNSTSLFVDYYPFFRMENGQESIVRLLEDADEENPLPYKIEKLEHKIHINGVAKTFPCLSMYGEDCPACERSSKYYFAAKKAKEETKGPNAGPNAKKGKYYWHSKTALVRALIIKDPLPIDPEIGSYEGKQCTLSLGKQIDDRIIAELSSFGDDDSVPWDLQTGYDFVIRRSKAPDGDNASYTGSSFARKSTAIPAIVQESIKLIDLKTLLPKNPGIEKVVAMLEAHDNGSDFVEEPSKSSKEETPSSKTVTQPIKEPVKEEIIAEFVEENPVESTATKTIATVVDDNDDDDILARIKNRNKK